MMHHQSPTHQLSSVILFDGVCNLCNEFVKFVIARDPAGRFQFGALQSPAAQRLLGSIDSREAWPDSMRARRERPRAGRGRRRRCALPEG